MLSETSETVDAGLMRRVADGDRDAFASLYDQYARPLYSLALRILNDQKEAEDVLQEVFVQIWEKAGQFDDRLGKPFTWSMTMTRNRAIDRLRSKQRQHRLVEELTQDAVTEAAASPANTGIEPGQAEHIRAAVNGLPEDQRKAIELAFFNGLTHFEIAEALREPLGTIKARIRRGMLRLRDILEGRV